MAKWQSGYTTEQNWKIKREIAVWIISSQQFLFSSDFWIIKLTLHYEIWYLTPVWIEKILSNGKMAIGLHRWSTEPLHSTAGGNKWASSPLGIYHCLRKMPELRYKTKHLSFPFLLHFVLQSQNITTGIVDSGIKVIGQVNCKRFKQRCFKLFSYITWKKCKCRTQEM